MWEINGKTSNRYVTGEVYHYLCGTVDKVQWYSAIWSPKNVPRHSFHSMKDVLDSISTRDRLIGWGLQVNYLCLLCNSETETRNHLYMDCYSSFDLCTLVAARCHLPPLRNMSDLLNQLIGLPPTKLSKLLVRLAWTSDIGSRSRETLGFMEILSDLSIPSSRWLIFKSEIGSSASEKQALPASPPKWCYLGYNDMLSSNFVHRRNSCLLH